MGELALDFGEIKGPRRLTGAGSSHCFEGSSS